MSIQKPNKVVYVLDENLDIVGVIDDYYSLIWTERYFEDGDFEIELPLDYDGSSYLTTEKFLQIPDSDVIMMVEGINPRADIDDKTLIISGGSAAALLKRRSVTTTSQLVGGGPEGYVYNTVRNQMFLNGDSRDIPVLSGTTYTGDVLGLSTITKQVDPATVYDIVVDICLLTDCGFRVIRSSANPELLKFEMYKGSDRTINQTTNPWVIFSEDFGNLLSGSYRVDHKKLVNVVRVIADIKNGAEGEQVKRDVWIETSEPSGLNRFEKNIEITLDKEIDEGWPLNTSELEDMADEHGKAELKKLETKDLFDGEFAADGSFKYGVDFFMGDLVQVVFQNREIVCRVVELVRSYTQGESSSYLSLTLVDY